jgi:hypothetical protein
MSNFDPLSKVLAGKGYGCPMKVVSDCDLAHQEQLVHELGWRLPQIGFIETGLYWVVHSLSRIPNIQKLQYAIRKGIAR